MVPIYLINNYYKPIKYCLLLESFCKIVLVFYFNAEECGD